MASKTVRFYSKPDCPLCDKGFPILQALCAQYGFEVEKINIEDDPELLERHRHRIPVVELEGIELGWGRLSERALKRKLEAIHT